MEIAWFTDAILLSEGDNVSVSIILDRPPGVMFTVSIIVTDVDTTGIVYIVFLSLLSIHGFILTTQEQITSFYQFQSLLILIRQSKKFTFQFYLIHC